MSEALNRCLEAFKAHYGQRGWIIEVVNNPSGFIEFSHHSTDILWTGWRSAWEACEEVKKGETADSVKDRLQRQGVEALFREAQAKVKPQVDKEREAEGPVDNIRMGNNAETPQTWTVYDLDDPKGYKTFYSEAAAMAHSEKITKIEAREGNNGSF